MAKELNEETGFVLSIKTLIGIAFGIATVVGMWFALQADIQEAKELPVAPPPDVTRMLTLVFTENQNQWVDQ